MKTLREYTRLAKETLGLAKAGEKPRGPLARGFHYDSRPQRLCDVVKSLVYRDSWQNWYGRSSRDAKLRLHQDFIEVYGRDAYLDHLIGLSESLPVDESEGPVVPGNLVGAGQWSGDWGRIVIPLEVANGYVKFQRYEPRALASWPVKEFLESFRPLTVGWKR